MSCSRTCAVLVSVELDCLIFNIYMSCDNKNNITEYTSVWETIIDTCEKLATKTDIHIQVGDALCFVMMGSYPISDLYPISE